jgi:hypothetical protein
MSDVYGLFQFVLADGHRAAVGFRVLKEPKNEVSFKNLVLTVLANLGLSGSELAEDQALTLLFYPSAKDRDAALKALEKSCPTAKIVATNYFLQRKN